MQDEIAPYYYPNPSNHKERMYVREEEGVIQFRLWNQDIPEIWEKHGWLDYDLISRAAALYSGDGPNPLSLYDMDSASFLLKEQKKKN